MKTCIDCERPMVPERTTAGPGVVKHKARGLCLTCYRRQFDRTQTHKSEFAACSGCGIVRRVRRAGTGLCKNCYDLERWGHPGWQYDSADVELTGGRWVPNGRGIVVWQEDSAA